MTRITYEQKVTALDHAMAAELPENMKEALQAVKLDVVKAHSKGSRTVPKEGSSTPGAASKPDNTLYNRCMGRYRAFLKDRGSFLDMTGRKAYFTSTALRQILDYLRKFQQSNDKLATDEEVYQGFDFMFTHWDRLNDFHRNRLMLQDIYKYIEEILPMIRNGRDQKSAQQNELQSFKQSLTK